VLAGGTEVGCRLVREVRYRARNTGRMFGVGVQTIAQTNSALEWSQISFA